MNALNSACVSGGGVAVLCGIVPVAADDDPQIVDCAVPPVCAPDAFIVVDESPPVWELESFASSESWDFVLTTSSPALARASNLVESLSESLIIKIIKGVEC